MTDNPPSGAGEEPTGEPSSPWGPPPSGPPPSGPTPAPSQPSSPWGPPPSGPPPSGPTPAPSQPPPPGYGQPPYGQPEYGQYGQPPYGQYGQPPYGQPYGYAPTGYARPNSGKATTVLVLGILSLVLLFTCGLGFILAIVALSIAGGARREIADSGGRLGGEGMVKAGVVCSWITIGFTALAVVGLVIAAATGAFSGSTS